MGFNYALEKRKFDLQWSLNQKAYRKAGMSKEDIQAMKEFDWDFFLSERRFRMHTQPLPSEYIDDNDEDGMSGLFKKFDSLKVTFGVDDLSGRYNWVEALEDEALASKLKRLKAQDLELLTLVVIDELSQEEIAQIQHTKRQNICNKITRIKNFLK